MSQVHLTPLEQAIAYALHAWRPRRFTPEWLARWLDEPVDLMRAFLGIRPVGPVEIEIEIDYELRELEAARYLVYQPARLFAPQLCRMTQEGTGAKEAAGAYGLPVQTVELAMRSIAVNRQAHY